jgi:poly(U)-specific endoribonuclease
MTKERQAEEIKLLHAIVATPVMKYAHKFLVAKKLAPADEAEFKKHLHDIWFKVYNRGGGVRVRVFGVVEW